MAQSGYTPILIYASGTAAALPSAANLTSSANGAELALNYADGKLYYKNSSGVVTLLASAAAASGTSPGGSNTQVQYNNAGAFGGSANFVFDGTNVGIGTSSPGTKLTVSTSGADGINISADTGTTTQSGRLFLSTGTAGQAYALMNIAGALAFNSGATANVSSGTERMRLDSSGNLGLGVTPSAWSGMTPAVEIGGYGSAVASWGSNRNLYLLSNAYYGSGGFTYKTTGGAAYYNVSGETNSHKWFTAPSGTAGNAITFTQAMTLDASGNLALGGTSVIGGARADFRQNSNGNYSTTFTTATTKALLHLRDLSDVATYPTTFSTLLFGAGDSGAAYTTITCIRESSQNSAIAFGTASGSSNTTERARITSGGNLLIGTTTETGSGRLRVVDSIRVADSNSETNALLTTVSSTASTIETRYSTPLILGTSATERARISAAGGFSVGTTADPGAGAIYATGAITAYYSDARLKDVKGTIINALDKVSSLSGVYYTNNEVAVAHGYTSAETQVGLLAQDVEAVLPEVVKAAPFDLDEKGNSKSGEHYKTIQYERVIPLLVEAIKELRAEVQALRG